MLTLLDASAVRRWCHGLLDSLDAHRAEIDDLNVYPIPDGDTGTNLQLTMRGAAEAVAADQSPGAGAVLAVLARGAMLAARGNSGVILAQYLRGLANGYTGVDAGDGASLMLALRLATDAAYSAVPEPAEGTILSVARGSADAVQRLWQRDGELDLAQVITEAVAGAERALAKTTEQLSVLTDAGVVDAGGKGLLVLLASLEAIVTGVAEVYRPGPRSRAALQRVREAGSSEYDFEIQYLLEARSTVMDELTYRLATIGDSVAVVGTTEGLYNVHVHANDVGAAIEAGIEAGRPHRITVVRFADQISAAAGDMRSGVALVAVAPGIGLADLFRSEGVTVVEGSTVLEGSTGGPTVSDVLTAVLDTTAAQVILLPNAAAIGAIAEQAAEQARERGIVVAVVPTKSPLQGLAAVAVHDSLRRFDDNVIALAEAAAGTRFAEVTIATSAGMTYAGRCEAGDVLGLIDGEVVEIGADVTAMGISLVRRLVAAGGELVTVLSGADPGAAKAASAVEDFVRREHALVEVSSLVGGQPSAPLLIGVE